MEARSLDLALVKGVREVLEVVESPDLEEAKAVEVGVPSLDFLALLRSGAPRAEQQ